MTRPTNNQILDAVGLLALFTMFALGAVLLIAALMAFVSGAPASHTILVAIYGAMFWILAALIHHWTQTQ